LAYNDRLARATPGASPLIPEEVSREIIEGAIQKSAALTYLRRTRMRRAQQRMPVLSQFPNAYWLTGADLNARDIGMKQTTSMQWDNVYLNAEEIAVVVPAPKSLLADLDYDFWQEVRPRVSEAIGLALDEAVFFGTNKPATWPTAIVPAAVAAGNQVVAATGAPDYLGDLNTALGMVEADGYDPDGIWARVQVRAWLRGLRTGDGVTTPTIPLFYPDSAPSGTMPGGTVYGIRIMFSSAGLSGFATGASNYSLITGDFSQAILATRDDISMEVFDTGVITDAGSPPVIQYNLLQQDMVALRVTARFAFAVPNPMNRQNQTAGTRYPFAVIKQAASTGGEV
jgi:HK97 family phage major capsid protein